LASARHWPADLTKQPLPTHYEENFMLKLNAGFSRKIGEPNFGSRGASVNVELELDSNLMRDPDTLCDRIRNLFDLARRSVDEELALDAETNGTAGQHAQTAQPGPPRGNGHQASQRQRAPSNDHSDPSVRHATASQLRAIRAICQRQQLDADLIANERFRVEQIEELTLQEASSLIDELKATATTTNNDNGRPQGSRRGGVR
jgi:hypothetical protein